MKTIVFIGQFDNKLASFRFRIEKALNLLSDQFAVTGITPSDFIKANNLFVGSTKADYFFMHKHVNPLEEQWIANFIKKHNLGTLVFDICDDHFDRQYGSHYKEMAHYADIITTTNERFARRIKEVTGKEALVCFDPINSLKGEFKPFSKPEMVWFGHSTNWQYAYSQGVWLPKYLENLSIYINLPDTAKDEVIFYDEPKFTLAVNKFEPGRVEKELRSYDVAFIPQDDNQNETKFKSPNRAVDALNAGLAVITNSEEVYGELRPFIFINKNIEHAYVDYLKCDKKALALKIEHGQKYIERVYSDDRIREQWQRVFNAA